jgi:hypothetical protein
MAKAEINLKWEDITDDPLLLAILKAEAVSDVMAERLRQHDKWGEQNLPDGTDTLRLTLARRDAAREMTDAATDVGAVTYRDILDEEVCEAFAETGPEKLRAELVQVAAVAVQWIEAIDRRKG